MALLRWLVLPLLFLTGCNACNREKLVEVGVQTRNFTLMPMGDPDASDFVEVLPALQQHFPGLSFTFVPTEKVPDEVWREKTSVFAELLMDLYKDRGPGLVLLLDEELSTQVFSYVYSQVDLPRGNAVVALPRMRTADGAPPKDGQSFTDAEKKLAQHRIANQTVNAVGKLLGLFPCKEDLCVFRRPENVTELDKVSGVCDRHKIHLEQKLQALTAAK